MKWLINNNINEWILQYSYKNKHNSTNDGASFYCSKYFSDIDFGTLFQRKVLMLLLKENVYT